MARFHIIGLRAWQESVRLLHEDTNAEGHVVACDYKARPNYLIRYSGYLGQDLSTSRRCIHLSITTTVSPSVVRDPLSAAHDILYGV
jgi:hypothetical protein